MRKEEFVKEVARRTDFTRKDVLTVLNTMLDVIADELKKGGRVMLTGFGTFDTLTKKQRTAVMPGGKSYKVPKHKIPHFTPGATLKRTVYKVKK